MERDEANGGLLLPSDTFTISHRGLIIELAARYRVPALYAHDFCPRDGGLASYSVAVGEQFAQAADYTDRILKELILAIFRCSSRPNST
jgi:putative tryptophan/tyrosine transport system substrate-binding protein